jgi:hypothetical protein
MLGVELDKRSGRSKTDDSGNERMKGVMDIAVSLSKHGT